MHSKSKFISGKVAYCKSLNIKRKPISSSDIVCVLNTGSKLDVDIGRSTNEWFKVVTESGIEGYCMRSFVSINV